MPLDAICLSAVVRETAAQAENTRIEKIQQPARDQVVLLLRGGRRLLLCAGATQPRLHLTEQLRDNPSQPPMFCMLLRKHLAGGRILSVVQEPLERVVTLHIQAADELGEQRPWRLILEAMPRHANLILVDHQGRITDCLRRVDFEMSQQRQVLPGLFYHLPPRQEKRSPLEIGREEFLELLSALPEDAPLDGWLLDTFTALPPLLARELATKRGITIITNSVFLCNFVRACSSLDVVLLGGSGCGKSTALRSLAGLEDIQAGRILVGGQDVTGVPVNKRDMAMVFQAYSLFPHMTALQNVEFGLEIRGVDRAERRRQAMEKLELVGLADQAKKYTQQMSGGQQQRVAIARALANNPSIMLCDEATSALDSTTTAQILDLLRRINRELNVTLVVITHSLSVARNICDRVAMIDGGRIVEMGDTEALFADPHSDILKTLIADAKVTNHRHTHETADGAKNGAADDSAQKEVK